MTWFVYPEDEGTTGSTNNALWDWNAAANLASLVYEPNSADFVVTGFGLTYDQANTQVDVASGMARVSDTSAQDAASGAARPWGVTYIVANDTATNNLALIASAINEIWLDVDLTAGDGGSITVIEQGVDTVPTSPALKLGEIDTTNHTTTETNRAPSIRATSLAGPITGDVTITDLIGAHLAINSGTVDVDVTGMDPEAMDGSGGISGQFLKTDGSTISWADVATGVAVQDSGTAVASNVDTLNFANNLTVTDDGSGKVSIAASGGGGSSGKFDGTSQMRFHTKSQGSFTNGNVSFAVEREGYVIASSDAGEIGFLSDHDFVQYSGAGSRGDGIAHDGRYIYQSDYDNGATFPAIHVYDALGGVSHVTDLDLTGTYEWPHFVLYHDNHLYLTSFTASSVGIVDVSTPSTPSWVGTVATNGSDQGADIENGFLYVMSGGVIEVFDLTTPASPSNIGTYNTGSTGQNKRFVRVHDTMMSYADGDNNTLYSLDVSDPASISVNWSTTYSNPYSFAVKGDYGYVTRSDGTVAIVDARDPANPVVGGFSRTGPRAVMVGDGGSFIGWDTAGNIKTFE